MFEVRTYTADGSCKKTNPNFVYALANDSCVAGCNTYGQWVDCVSQTLFSPKTYFPNGYVEADYFRDSQCSVYVSIESYPTTCTQYDDYPSWRKYYCGKDAGGNILIEYSQCYNANCTDCVGICGEVAVTAAKCKFTAGAWTYTPTCRL
ncbi:hypothetical protein Pelo_19786 [Pelomyxa schiedti]|nr:hypothetical protein Pelo_19786 [Pelomyxa schiedti]